MSEASTSDPSNQWTVLDKGCEMSVHGCSHAAHVAIYSVDDDKKPNVFIQLRNDSIFDFYGGSIEHVCKATEIVAFLSEQLQNNVHLDMTKYKLNHLWSYYCVAKNLVRHFYALEVSVDDTTGWHTATIGIVRVPLGTEADEGGLPIFLTYVFNDNARDQLTSFLNMIVPTDDLEHAG
jgi:hypothetical protein